MRKVIGIGETILDILFKDSQPTAAVPGGSVFNGIISLGRLGVNVTFISETGNDKVGDIILKSLAFLNEQNDAEYLFYKDYPRLRLDVTMPEIHRDDIVMIGSYYAVTPQLRDKVKELLDKAREKGAIIYYDVNFRSTHKNEAIKLLPVILENFEYADIIRGSVEDFENMFGLTDADKVYKSKIEFYCPHFICTHGGRGIRLYTKNIKKHYEVDPLQTVSTVGAGDNFNAGVVFGLLKYRIRRDDLDELSEDDWDHVIRCGKDFSADVCMSLNNSISKEFAAGYR